jgi:hypothetical protein
MREQVSLCPDYLVLHRNHSGQLTNIYSEQALKDANVRRRMLKRSLVQLNKQKLADTKFALEKGWISEDVYRLAERILSEKLHREELDFSLYWGSFLKRWAILLSNWRVLYRDKRLSEILFAAMPRPLYMLALRLKAHVRKGFLAHGNIS